MSEMIYILLPVHNRREITRRFIECLKVQTYQKFHLILIDDGSSDGTAAMVQENISSLTVITGKGDWWWAGALQQGYDWFKKKGMKTADVVLIANDDTEFEFDFLEKGIKHLRQNPDALVLASCYDRKTRNWLESGVNVDWSKRTFIPATTPDDINCLSTCGLFLYVDSLFRIGGFRPLLLPHYLSDYEFTIRAQRKGMKLMSPLEVRLWLNRDTTGIHRSDKETVRAFVSNLFSIRSSSNPFFWSSFIIFACPWQWKIKHLLIVWIDTLRLLLMCYYRARKVIEK